MKADFKSRRGVTLIEVLVVIAIAGMLMGLALPAIQMVREASYRVKCQNNLKQIGLALTHYHEERRHLPAGCSYHGGKDPYAFMSWCTRILPFLEHGSLWQQAEAAYKLEPYFRISPPHIGRRVVTVFLCPSNGRESFTTPDGEALEAFTFYLGVEGTNQLLRNGVLYLDSKVRLNEISDGLSQTLMVGERPPSRSGALGWWYAGVGQDKNGSADMILGAREIPGKTYFDQCPPESNLFRQGRGRSCDALHFWSDHHGGAHFLFCDGSVRLLSYSADKILPALATRAGNETVELP